MSNVHSITTCDGTMCVVVDGKNYTISVKHPAYVAIRDCLSRRPFDEALLLSLLDIPKAINHVFSGKVKVDLDAGKVWYDGTEFHDEAFTQRILRLMSEGHDVTPMVNFLNNLGQNPSYRAMMETFKFLDHEGMPITEDGCFLGYKGVTENYYDKFSRTINNTPDGRRVEVPRDNVCDNPDRDCAQGLHVGSYGYATGWAGDDGVVLLVKVNPRDVVSVPSSDCRKMRVCGYWCLKALGRETKPLEGEVYTTNGQRVPTAQFDHETGDHWEAEYLEEECEYCGALRSECECDDEELYCYMCHSRHEECQCYSDQGTLR